MIDHPWPAPPPATRQHPPHTRRTRIALAGGAAAALASAIWLGNSATLVGTLALFLIARPLERLWRRHPVPLRRFGLRTDLVYAVVTPAIGAIGVFVGFVVGAASLAWLPGLLARPLVDGLPTAARAVLGVILFDVVTYWAHRWSHTVPVLWRFHAIHHSSVHLDWISGIRNHPFDGLVVAPAAALLVGAGFDGAFVGALAVVQFVIGLWSHLNVSWRLRPLQRVLLTPEFHHWHHANQPEAHNTNFSVLLPLWDLAFGTYYMPADRRPQRYGVSEPVPDGFLGQMAYPFHGWRGRLRRRSGRGTATL